MHLLTKAHTVIQLHALRTIAHDAKRDLPPLFVRELLRIKGIAALVFHEGNVVTFHPGVRCTGGYAGVQGFPFCGVTRKSLRNMAVELLILGGAHKFVFVER